MERGFIKLNIAVLAVSEPGASDDATKLVVDRIGEAGHAVSASPIEDSVQRIRARLLELVADAGVDVVIVLAGLQTESAGLALDPLITHGLNGFSDLLRMIAYQEIGSAAMLVDAEAAKCKSTFVFVLPAVPSQVKLALEKLLVPQLDYRTRPRNIVMQIPRVGHADAGEETVVAPMKDTTTAPMPWIVARAPGDAVPVARTVPPPAPRKSMSMSVAEALPSPSASMSAVLSKVSAAVSVSQPLPSASPFAVHEPTKVQAPPPVPRGKPSATISAPLPIKPPAKFVPLAPMLPEPTRKMISLAELDDEGDDLDEIDQGVAEIVDEPPRLDDVAGVIEPERNGLELATPDASTAEVEATPASSGASAAVSEAPAAEVEVSAALVESSIHVEGAEVEEPPEALVARLTGTLPPPRRASDLETTEDPAEALAARVTSTPPRRANDSLPPPRTFGDSLPPLYDDSPRRIAEPRAPRRRSAAIGLLLMALMLLATTAVLVVVILRKTDREARAAAPERGELLATRDPGPLPADPPMSVQAASTGGVSAVEVTPTELPAPPREIEMPPPESAPAKPSRSTRVPKVLREPEPARDPAEVLATAPVNTVEDGCDEVSCILDKYKQSCCARWKPVEVAPPVAPPSSSGLPAKLDKGMVQRGLAAVKPAVIACGERIAVRGTVKVSVSVSPSGKVLSAMPASAPDPELGACVAAAVRLAKFAETDEGGSFGYPFAF